MLRALDALMKAVRLACGLAFAGFCALILVQVVNRYALGLAMFWTEELVLLLFVWSVMLGVPAALWWRDEIVVDIIQLPAAFDRGRLMMVDVLSMLFLLALTWSGLAFMQRGGISMSPALGLPRSLVIRRIAFRAARAGVITGVLLATARVAGETAPLLFTALSNQFWSVDMGAAMANLPVTINNFVQSPYESWRQLAWTGALLITLAVLALNIVARVLGAERKMK